MGSTIDNTIRQYETPHKNTKHKTSNNSVEQGDSAMAGLLPRISGSRTKKCESLFWKYLQFNAKQGTTIST